MFAIINHQVFIGFKSLSMMYWEIFYLDAKINKPTLKSEGKEISYNLLVLKSSI